MTSSIGETIQGGTLYIRKEFWLGTLFKGRTLIKEIRYIKIEHLSKIDEIHFLYHNLFNLYFSDKTDLKTNKTSPRLGCTSVIRHHGGISISGCGKSGNTRSVSGMEESYACRLLSNLNALRQDSKGFNLCDVEIVAGLDQVRVVTPDWRFINT